jgi:hypothetical protein
LRTFRNRSNESGAEVIAVPAKVSTARRITEEIEPFTTNGGVLIKRDIARATAKERRIICQRIHAWIAVKEISGF